jgi:Holliday junction resolvasome RuvABC endonuclease subunit
LHCILGVDPGASGALAFYWPSEPTLISVMDMPLADGKVCPVQLRNAIATVRPSVAWVEKVHAMPGQGVTSMFNFGVSFGVTKGVILALDVPLHFTRPNQWKKAFGLRADKEQARELAIRLWPEHGERFARKKDAGRAEAALIARYGSGVF